MSSTDSIDPVTKRLVGLFPTRNAKTADRQDGLESEGTATSTLNRRQKLNSRRNNNVAQRENHVFLVNEEEIFAVTQEHEKFGEGRMKLKGLTRFDDCSAYGVSDEAHKELLRKEIKKIVNVSTLEGPYLFDSKGMLSKAGLADFEDVESILDQIYCNFSILTHDNAQVGMWNASEKVLEEVIFFFKRSRARLLFRFGGPDDSVEGAEPLVLEPPERNFALYHAFLDYILATVARVVLRSATSRRWVKYSLAILAMWAVKLKLVAYEPGRYAKLSISNGEDNVDRLANELGSARLVFLKVHMKKQNAEGDNEDKETQHDTLSTNTSLKTSYYETHLSFRNYLRDFFRYAIVSILDVSNTEKGISSKSFEACTLVYKAGLERVLTAVNQDRFGGVTFSSNALDISSLYGGLLLLRTNIRAIQSRNRESTASVPPQTKAVAATVKWDWTTKHDNSNESRDQCTFLYSMDDIVSIAVLQGLATLYCATSITEMIRMVTNDATTKDPVLPFAPPPKSFQAMFHIMTEDCLRAQKQAKSQHLEDPDVEFMSSSPLRLGIRAGTNLMELGALDRGSEADERARQILTEYKMHKQKMRSWIISEDSITIQCQLYVITIISIAVAIVCGSMAVPFVVRNSISGVDPFQFATFAWVIMGFFVVIAKSRYVSDWPWHHFLHGRIVCKSLSDVRDVTGIDAQMILMNLLHGEKENILKTRGPFNGMFSRKSDGSDGFSINEPVKLSTMLAGGIIVLKVANETGEHLICADIRKGADFGQFLPDEREDYLAYKDVDVDESDAESDNEFSPQYFTEEREKGSKPKKIRERGAMHSKMRDRDQNRKVFLLKKEKLRYKKLIGMYTRDSLFG